MALRHSRERGYTAPGSIPFNFAQCRWVNFRVWNMGSVAGTLRLIGIYPKPYLHIRNMLGLDKAFSNLLFFWPMNDVIYDGPQSLTPSNYTTSTRTATEPISGFAGVSNTLLTKNGPMFGNRNGNILYSLQPGQNLTVALASQIRAALAAGATFAVEFTILYATNSAWIIIDGNTILSEYAGFFISSGGALQFLDSKGNSNNLGTMTTGWHHYLIVYQGGNFATYRDGVLLSTIARAAVAYTLPGTSQWVWNYTASNYITMPAFYYNFPAGLDWQGTAQRHYEDQFLNYKVVNPLYDAGTVAGFQGWGTIMSRDVAPGIPDVINIEALTPANSLWYYEVSMEMEE